MSHIIKTNPNGLAQNRKILQGGAPNGLAARVAAAKKQAAYDTEHMEERATAQAQEAITRTHRICVMPDCSGSMGSGVDGHRSRRDCLVEALTGFVEALDMETSAIAYRSFPAKDGPCTALCCDRAFALLRANDCTAGGETPMGGAMDFTLRELPINRGVIISDGGATDMPSPLHLAREYAEAQIPVDTVHISNSEYGEDTLRGIAQITGGIFIKFKDVAQFGKSLKYLTPRFRAMLMAPGAAELIGATEVKG